MSSDKLSMSEVQEVEKIIKLPSLQFYRSPVAACTLTWEMPLSGSRLFYAGNAISFTTMAAGPVSINFVCGETRRPAGNCFATPVLVG